MVSREQILLCLYGVGARTRHDTMSRDLRLCIVTPTFVLPFARHPPAGVSLCPRLGRAVILLNVSFRWPLGLESNTTPRRAVLGGREGFVEGRLLTSHRSAANVTRLEGCGLCAGRRGPRERRPHSDVVHSRVRQRGISLGGAAPRRGFLVNYSVVR